MPARLRLISGLLDCLRHTRLTAKVSPQARLWLRSYKLLEHYKECPTLRSKFGSLVISPTTFSPLTGMCNESGDLKTRKPKKRINRHDNIANARTYLGRAMAERKGSDWHRSCHRWNPEEKIYAHRSLLALTTIRRLRLLWTEGEKGDSDP